MSLSRLCSCCIRTQSCIKMTLATAPESLCSNWTNWQKGGESSGWFLKFSEHFCSGGIQGSCSSIQSAAFPPLQAKENVLHTSNRPVGKSFYNTSSLVILPLNAAVYMDSKKKSIATVRKTSPFKRSLEYWKLLYSPRWVKPGKAVFGVFASVTSYSRTLHDAEYKWELGLYSIPGFAFW